MTFLALDVGNTRLKWALYDEPRVGARLLAHGAQFLENIEKLAEGDWFDLPAPRWVVGCVVAGDAVKRRVEEQLELWDVAPQWVVSSSAEAGLVNGYDHPARLGSDRWVAMIGARQRLLAKGPSRPCVVVMVGTAVTVEAIDTEGRFLGGIILPGPRHHVAGAGVGHRRSACAHRRGARLSHQHQRRAHQRGHLCHCRRGAAHGGKPAAALRRRPGLLHDRWRGLEDGAQHVHRGRAGGQPDL
jgi:pantothenate kinase type III